LAFKEEKAKGGAHNRGGVKAVSVESLLATAILIIALLIFLLIFAFMAISLIRWFKTPAYQPPAVKVEDYACPKCGSKDLEIVGGRTLKCRKCGTTFTIQPETTEERWIILPFFWWLPIIWPLPVEKQ